MKTAMKHDLIHIQGKPFVLMPLHDYRSVIEKHTPDGGGKELPNEIRDELAAAQDSPVKIVRRYRGMTQEELAQEAGISRPYLTEIERGQKPGSLKALRALADALDVDMGTLVA